MAHQTQDHSEDILGLSLREYNMHNGKFCQVSLKNLPEIISLANILHNNKFSGD